MWVTAWRASQITSKAQGIQKVSSLKRQDFLNRDQSQWVNGWSVNSLFTITLRATDGFATLALCFWFLAMVAAWLKGWQRQCEGRDNHRVDHNNVVFPRWSIALCHSVKVFTCLSVLTLRVCRGWLLLFLWRPGFCSCTTWIYIYGFEFKVSTSRWSLLFI